MIFGCTHAPLNDPEYDDWLNGEIVRRKPDIIIHAGDLLEASHASRFPREYDWSLKYEIEEAQKYLAKKNEIHKGPAYFLAGNHDDNARSVSRLDGRLLDYIDPKSLLTELNNWGCDWEYTYAPGRVRGCLQIGWVTVMHGYEHNGNADEFQACLSANPYGLYVGVHTHKPTPVTQARKGTIQLPYWYANAGCGRNLKPDYVKRKRTHSWGQGYVWFATAITVRMEYDMRQRWGLNKHPMWDAETVIYRMAGEE
jgi:predicted phosphodiesterase